MFDVSCSFASRRDPIPTAFLFVKIFCVLLSAFSIIHCEMIEVFLRESTVMIKYTDEDEIQAAFEYYRERGFPYPELQLHEIIHIFRKLQATKAKINKAKPNLFNTKVKVIEIQPIGDIQLAVYFHPHIWESHAVGMHSAMQSYGIDKSLLKVMSLCMKHYGEITDNNVRLFLCLVNGTQVCSNFRPTVAKAVYDYFRPKDVLDMSAGYGGRLMGFIASSCKGDYTGVDPSFKSCHGNREIAQVFGVKGRVKIIASAFEDNWEKVEGLPKVDLAFTSTPYYLKEIYEESNPNQSRERYPKYKDWLKGFLKPMLKKTKAALRPKGVLALNIADVKIRNKTFPLNTDAVRIAQHLGFTLIEQLEVAFFGFGRGLSKQKTEPIFIFRKS